MKIKFAAVSVGALSLMLSACGVGSDTSDAPPSPTSTSETPPLTTTTVLLPTPNTLLETTLETPTPATIIGCQSGYNPIETTWSDGTVTGYSDYCQTVRDAFLQSEIVPDSGPTEFVCESGHACGITEADGVVCDESGCRSTWTE
ncbi:hypothetical protein BH686_06770 [Rhodococcus erythropolis]|nr:hypothetical protein BH686_06770 [Rhodococcus erythropolis]